MDTSRRDFLKISGVTTAGLALGSLGFDLSPAQAYVERLRTRFAKEMPSICPFCSVGCGQIISVEGGKVINIEGDPDHPVNLGSLCSKGSALYQVANNERRLTRVQYRAPASDHWMEVSWDWALEEIAKKIKATRDDTFRMEEDGVRVNRTEGIAQLGGAAHNNEECYLLSKLARALGIVYLEHQARI